MMTEFIEKTFDHLHSIAEVGFKEVKTSAYLADQLESFGYEVTRNVGTTGIVAVLDSGVEGKSFGLRADMDALEFEIDGVKQAIHACGHDANSTMVLAAAKNAAKRGIKKGKLYIVFQQAEEKIGSIEMAESGEMEGIENLIGIHLRPNNEAKLGEAVSAMRSGASYYMRIDIRGKSSHGARPHQGVNALNVAVAIINAANGLKEDTTVPHSLKATQIETVGNTMNTIPNKCVIHFDLRSRTNEVADNLIERMKVLVRNVAFGLGAKVADIEVGGMPAAEIDPYLHDICDEAVKDVLFDSLGERFTVGGEDIHYFNRICGIKIGYIGIGANMTAPLHTPEMSFDKKALKYGVDILTRVLELSMGLKG